MKDMPPAGKAGKQPAITIAISVIPHPPGHGPDMLPDRAENDMPTPIKPRPGIPRSTKAGPLKPAPPRGL